MQPSGHQALRFAFHGNFDAVAPRGRGRNGIRAPHRNSRRRNAERQKLSGEVSEGKFAAFFRPKTESLHVVGDRFNVAQRQFPEPPDLASDWIVLLVMRRSSPHVRRLWEDFHLFMPWLGGGEAFAECEEESRVAFQANSSSEQRWNQALFLRDKPEPGSAIGRDVDVRSSHQAVLHFYGSV